MIPRRRTYRLQKCHNFDRNTPPPPQFARAKFRKLLGGDSLLGCTICSAFIAFAPFDASPPIISRFPGWGCLLVGKTYTVFKLHPCFVQGNAGEMSSNEVGPAKEEESSEDTLETARSSALVSRPVQPRPRDIILGRGRVHSERSGNTHFHSLVDRYMNGYHNAPDRKQKSAIIHTVYMDLCSTACRFLRREPKTDIYEEVGEAYAKEKISHAFRDKRRKQSKAKESMKSLHDGSGADMQEQDDREDSKPKAKDTSYANQVHIAQKQQDVGKEPSGPEAVEENEESSSERASARGSPRSGSSLFSDRELSSVLDPIEGHKSSESYQS